MRQRNRWHKVANGYWMCAFWDVIREKKGVWTAQFAILWRRENYLTFRTAQQAMDYVDNLIN